MRTHWDPGMNMAAKAEAAAQKNLSSSRKALMEAAQQFEALFLNLLLAEMRRLCPKMTCSAISGRRSCSSLC